MMTLSPSDFFITIAYFSIPLQILVALCKFPRLTRQATKRVVILLILFALFIFLCGAGHLIRCIGLGDTTLFNIVNALTAVISLLTAVYLLPFVPHLLEGADRMYLEATTSKRIIESMYPPTFRERLLHRDGSVLPTTAEEGGVSGSGGSKKEGDSLAIRRIQSFIQRKRGSISVYDLKDSVQQTSDPEPIADTFPHTSVMFGKILFAQ